MMQHKNAIDWVVQHGGFMHPDIRIDHTDEKGYHMRVAPVKRLAQNTRIATCPMEVTMCVLNPLDIKPFSCRGVRFPQSFLDKYCTTPEILHTFFLMEHYLLGQKSWWKHYLVTLPSPDDVKETHFDSSEDSVWIRGTNFEGAVYAQEQKWQNNYVAGLKDLQAAGWHNAVQKVLTWDLFRWAAIIFGTRSFTSQVLSDTTAADLARPIGRNDPNHPMLANLFSERFAVLLPVLDVLNHRPGAQIEWQARYSFVGLEVLENYEEGQEIFNNYGPRDNESLLLSYGFVAASNQFDHIAVSVRVPPGSPLADTRTWPVDSRSNEHFNCYIFGISHPLVREGSHLERALFSYDLLDSISVLVANDREMQMMYETQKTIMSTCLPHSFADYRNLLSTITQILQDCRARVQRIHHFDPRNLDPPQTARTQKQRYALAYRDCQISMLRHAVAVCVFTILHAATDLRDEEVCLLMQEKMPQFYVPEMQQVVRRLPCLTRPGELLTIDGIMASLPNDLRPQLEACIKSITRAQDQLPNVPTCHSNVVKSGFAIALSALCCESEANNGLGERMDHWIHDLKQWYPPTDENWCYVPSPGPWAPGEEPPLALVTLLSVIRSKPELHANPWLQPARLCWGWNVMEEEGVRVPLEIELYCNDLIQARVEEDAIGFLLYCRQCTRATGG